MTTSWRPVEKVIEAARPIEAEFSSLVEDEVIGAVVGDVNVEAIACSKPTCIGRTPSFSDSRLSQLEVQQIYGPRGARSFVNELATGDTHAGSRPSIIAACADSKYASNNFFRSSPLGVVSALTGGVPKSSVEC